MNCWEWIKCGREEGGKLADTHGVCPAYPRHGKRCASVVGTLCDGKVKSSQISKMVDCLKCDYYLSEHYGSGFNGK